MSSNLAPLRYVNDENAITEDYPFNPNRSPDGMSALCSEDGRHLAMMPHPERVFRNVQLSWTDLSSTGGLNAASPWIQLWHNARKWVG